MSPWQYTNFIVYKMKCCVIDWHVVFICYNTWGWKTLNVCLVWTLDFAVGSSSQIAPSRRYNSTPGGSPTHRTLAKGIIFENYDGKHIILRNRQVKNFVPNYNKSLTLWRRNYFFFNFSTPVCKMWILQEPNKLALWNKLHFEEKKTESIEHV